MLQQKLAGLEQLEGEQIMKKYFFEWTIPLKVLKEQSKNQCSVMLFQMHMTCFPQK